MRLPVVWYLMTTPGKVCVVHGKRLVSFILLHQRSFTTFLRAGRGRVTVRRVSPALCICSSLREGLCRSGEAWAALGAEKLLKLSGYGLTGAPRFFKIFMPGRTAGAVTLTCNDPRRSTCRYISFTQAPTPHAAEPL